MASNAYDGIPTERLSDLIKANEDKRYETSTRMICPACLWSGEASVDVWLKCPECGFTKVRYAEPSEVAGPFAIASEVEKNNQVPE